MLAAEWLNELESLFPVTDGFRNSLSRELTPLSLPKNHHLQEAPRVPEHIYFLQDGFAMSYTFRDAERQVAHFWKPGQIISAFNGFIHQSRSMEYIQLMTRSDLMCLSFDSLTHLLNKYKEAQQLYRLIMDRSYERKLAHILDIRRLTVRQQYDKLLLEYPNIEQHIPQENIASWLGITPQSLSRLKRYTGRT